MIHEPAAHPPQTQPLLSIVVPIAFWWMSLTGATMLIIYFGWRKGAVGILGQATGWLLYVRNLWLIYKHQPPIPNA